MKMIRSSGKYLFKSPPIKLDKLTVAVLVRREMQESIQSPYG